MGNEIGKKYEMDEEPSASGGLACLWKIFKATDRASGQPVSVFVFSKDDLKEVDKALREQVLVIMRREIKVLEGMSERKHPSVVRLVESFEETKKLLAFVTERVACSLADAIGDGTSSLSPAAKSAARRGFERYEIARGIVGLCEGLQFVHTIRRRLHLNLAPESIFLSPSGQFKLGGFGFSVDLPSDGSSTTPCPFFQTGARSGFEGAWRLHPVMAFASPEATAPAGSNDVYCASDMFSLGCLIYQLCRDNPRSGRLITADATPQTHQTFCATLDYPGRINTSSLFPEAQSLVTSLVQLNPIARPTLGNVAINPMFHGNEVTVLRTIDSIPNRNPAEAATFLTSVRSSVPGFPLRVQRDCIMIPLMDSCAAERSGRLWAFALPIVTDVCCKLDRRQIVEGVQAKFKPALRAESVEALGSLVAAISLFLEKMEVTFFRSDVIPMVCRALQVQSSPESSESTRRALDVQEAALKAVSDEAFHRAIDGKTRELSLLPRVCWLVVKGTAVRVKVNALLCLSKTFHFFQVRAVVDKILPTLKFCAERDQTVAIQLCVLGCYDAIAKRLDKLGPIATQILPACTPMLDCKGLNSTQFEMVVGIIQGMFETAIAYRRREIANPSATAILDKKPTHPGGVADEEEIARQRAIALGGWKPAPPGGRSKLEASMPSSELPVFPGVPAPASSFSATKPVGHSASGFDMADVFGAPSLSGGSKATPRSSNPSLTPQTIDPTTAFGAGSALEMFEGMSVSQTQPEANGRLSGGTAPGPGSGFAANVFSDFSAPPKPSATNGSSRTSMYGGSADPFSSSGLGDAFSSLGGQATRNSSSSTGGGIALMDGASKGTGSSNVINSRGNLGVRGKGGRARQTPGSNNASGAGDFAVLGGGMQDRSSTPVRGMVLPQATTAGNIPSQVARAPAGDSFAAFFDAAIAGGSASAESPMMMASNPSTMLPAATARSSTEGFGTTSAIGGGSLEDQLAKTQREIAQLTRELGVTSGTVGNVAGATGAFGGTGGGGWGISNQTASPSVSVSGAGIGTPLTQQAQGGAEQDPFAFLSAKQDRGNGGKESQFDFFR